MSQKKRSFSSMFSCGSPRQSLMSERRRGRGRPKRDSSTSQTPLIRLALSRLGSNVERNISRSRSRSPHSARVHPAPEDTLDFENLTLFNFHDFFGRNENETIKKLKAAGLLILPDDLQLFKCPKCDGPLRRAIDQGLFGYRYRCKNKYCSGIIIPEKNTWLCGLRRTEENPNPILRFLKLVFLFLCGIGVGIAAEQACANPRTAQKVYRKCRDLCSRELATSKWKIGGPGLTV